MTSFVAFQFRRGLSSLWNSMGTTLAAGEPGVELDTGRFKLGDGSSGWNKLSYFSPSGLFYNSSDPIKISGSLQLQTSSFLQGKVYLITGSISLSGRKHLNIKLLVNDNIGTSIYTNTPTGPVDFTFSHTFVATNNSKITFKITGEVDTCVLTTCTLVQVC